MKHERLMRTRTNYWLGLALDLVLSTSGLVIACVLAPLVHVLGALAAGLVAYTLYEYCFHRWLYHGTGHIARLHAAHHREPDALFGAPIYFSLGFSLVHGLAAAPVVGGPAALCFGSALLFGYAQQSVIHHITHNWPYTDRRLLRIRLRRHHLIHHHDEAVNFGMSTFLWDRVFGTLVTTSGRRTHHTPARTALHEPYRLRGIFSRARRAG